MSIVEVALIALAIWSYLSNKPGSRVAVYLAAFAVALSVAGFTESVTTWRLEIFVYMPFQAGSLALSLWIFGTALASADKPLPRPAPKIPVPLPDLLEPWRSESPLDRVRALLKAEA